MDQAMFCFQCQETALNKGCTKVGVCGKKADTAVLQDLLRYVTAGLSAVTTRLRSEGKKIDKDVNHLVTANLFTTITNANFDDDSLIKKIKTTVAKTKELAKNLDDNADLPEASLWSSDDKQEMLEKGSVVGVMVNQDEDIRSLKELNIYGLKGMAAYVKHANVLKADDDDIDAYIQSTLVKTVLENSHSVDDLVALTLKTGEYGVKAMALLDGANTKTYGNPEITKVDLGVRGNPGILISGHDLRDLEMLLEQTEGTGVDVYTHSEMLPAQYYPYFKKYAHFAGNYGSSWWKQKEDFDTFNGPVLMTTNCIVPTKESYHDRVFTTGATGYPGCRHIPGEIGEEKDFSEIIALAKTCPPPTEIESGQIVGGFAHAQVFALADKVVEAVKSGAIKKFVVMSGCDGRMRSRDYYTKFAEALPKDTVILTSGCAKYRYIKLPLGDIGGIPRVLDAGQCNDSYSWAVVAMKLKEIFNAADINDLPIEFNVAWYEQKAVIVLLGLLSLGIKNIHIGPTLPAFLSPNVTNVLVEHFGLGGIKTVEEDIELMMA